MSENQNSNEEEGLMETMFGSVLMMPLPVPEIIGTLEKGTF